jgi:hypothetical protein
MLALSVRFVEATANNDRNRKMGKLLKYHKVRVNPWRPGVDIFLGRIRSAFFSTRGYPTAKKPAQKSIGVPP